MAEAAAAGTREATVIGRTTRIRGRITGKVDLEILGHVDGEIAIDGDLTLDAQGLIGANVSARRMVVRGAVRGDLTGDEVVVLEDGARVVGDVRAPRIAIAPGALVRGYVQTGDIEASPARARAQQASAPRAAPSRAATPVVARPASVGPVVAKPAVVKPAAMPAPQPALKPAPKPATVKAPLAPVRSSVVSNGNNPRPTPSALAGATPKGPPDPVVPALKKGAKGAMKRKG